MKKAGSTAIKPIHVWISGLSGRMGQSIAQAIAENPRFELIGGGTEKMTDLVALKKADVIIDFSSISGNGALLKTLTSHKAKTVLIGTTGLTEKTLEKWADLAKKNLHRVLFAPNTSIGIYLLMTEIGRFANILVPAGFDIEIVETHHNRKKDAPSGTALLLAKSIQKEFPNYKVTTSHEALRQPKSIGVHAVRGGGVFGEHEVRFISEHEEITVSHRAFSRALFAHGALNLAEKIHVRKAPGFVTLNSL